MLQKRFRIQLLVDSNDSEPTRPSWQDTAWGSESLTKAIELSKRVAEEANTRVSKVRVVEVLEEISCPRYKSK